MASPYEPQPFLSPADADMPPSELIVMDVLAAAEEQPLVDEAMAKSMAEPHFEGRLGPVVESREERQAAGYEAYAEATKRREANGDELDEETVALYRKASIDLLTADVWYGMGDRPRNPFNMLTRAACLGWQAEGTPPNEFYESPFRHIDVKSDLQRLADEELERANEILLGGDETIKALAGEMTAVNPKGIIANAGVEASGEAGTAEHIEIRGLGGVDEGTSERLVAGGQEALARFTVENAMQAEHGGKFTAIMAQKEATALHHLPVKV